MGLIDMILGARGGNDNAGGLGGGLGGLAGGLTRGGMGGKGALLMALLPVVLRMLSNRRTGNTGSAGGGGLFGGGGGAGGGLFGGGGGGISGGGLGGLGALAGAGGLGALLAHMADRGFGDHAQSWVGTGPNQPLPDGALDQLFDRQQLGAIAAESGLSDDETRAGLHELLPQVVDHLTPGGQVPDDDRLLSSIDDFERQLQGQ